MNRDRLIGNWNQLTGKLREQWGKLTNDEAGVIAARRWQFAGRIQAMHGVALEKSALELKEFFLRNRKWHIST